MNDIVNEQNKKKQELNCGVNIIPVIHYMETLFGIERTKDIVESLGLPMNFLKNRRNWVSYKFYVDLLQKLVDVTEDDKAPFKATFNVKPQSLFEEFYFATYSALLSESPKKGYKLAFSKNFYTKFTKIGDFELLDEGKSSLKVKLTLKEGYKQSKLNCLSVEGFITSFPIGWGLPPATIKHTECAAFGKDSCIYEISWKEYKNSYRLFRYILLLLFLGVESFLLYFKFIDMKDMIITSLLFGLLFLLIRYMNFFNRTKDEELFNYKKNVSIFEAMEKIEKDYNEILSMKIELETRNKFLTIINDVNDKISKIKDFNVLLLNVADILIDGFQFIKAAYFQVSPDGDSYVSNFEIDKTKTFQEKNKPTRISITSNDYEEYYKFYNFIDYKRLKETKSTSFLEWIGENNGVCIIPIETYDAYSGFYCFVYNNKIILNDKLILDLFSNIANQLKIGYEKISSVSIIENILSTIPASVLIFDKEKMSIKYFNKMFISNFEFLNIVGQIYGNKLFDILPFDEESKNFITNVLNIKNFDKENKNFQTTFQNRIFECNIFYLNDNGKEKLFGMVLTDITETKNFEQKIILNEKLLALGKAASGISHEINNPLYVVLANAEEISESKNVSPEIRQYADEIVDLIVNVSNVIKDLSTYSKNLRNERVDEVDLNLIIEEAFKIVKYSHNLLNVEIVKSFTTIPKIKSTKGEMEQIFINLFNNSLHAINNNGKIEVSTNFIDNKIQITVSDNGYGIKKEVIPYIFDLFFTTKKSGEGTGQGLHIVKKIVTKYKGTIEVKSEINKGTTFYINFSI